MTPRYFDIHSHLNASQYDQDREEVIRRMRESDTHTIVVGTCLEDSQRAVELAEKYPEIYATIGIHPTDRLESFKSSQFETLVKSKKVVAIGECGLDFFHRDKAKDYDRQKKLFINQAEFALEHNKLLMIHARDAYTELLDILKSLKGKIRGNVHFFAGDKDIAKKLFDMGFTISFTGVITFTGDYDEVIKFAPLDKILSETDAPYISPIPYRGKRNEPSYVSEVVKKIAMIRGDDEEQVRVTLVNNALSMIG